MDTMTKSRKRYTVKLPGDIYLQLRRIKQRTGVPIIALIRHAVANRWGVYEDSPAHLERTKRGSR